MDADFRSQYAHYYYANSSFDHCYWFDPGNLYFSVVSTPALTWTKRVDAQANASGNAEIYTAIFTAGGNISITTTWGVNGLSGVVYVVTGHDTTNFAGAAVTATGQAVPNVN